MARDQIHTTSYMFWMLEDRSRQPAYAGGSPIYNLDGQTQNHQDMTLDIIIVYQLRNLHHPLMIQLLHYLILVEIHREDVPTLPDLLRILGDCDRRAILFCDDLSFGSDEVGFRELKAALEGRLEAPPENVCLIATSNRRHLLPQSMAENREGRLDEEGELHLGEALEEKLALADRFGLMLGFFGFDQATYLSIVSHYLDRAGMGEMDDIMREEALRWALARGNRSGRTARQFVDDAVGRRKLGAQGFEF